MKTLFIIVLTFGFSFHLSAQWVEQESGTDKNLHHLYFLDEDNGWIIGEKIILKTVTGGQEWVDKSPPIPFDVFYKSLWFTDQNTGYIGCYFRSGTMQSVNPYPLKTFNGGTTWEYETSVVLTNSNYGGINDVFFINDMTGWMVRSKSIYKTTNGISGSFTMYSSLSERPYSIHFINQNVGWVAGNNGFISKTLDGGENWNDLNSSISSNLKSVYFMNSSFGWTTGYIDDIGTIIKTTDGGESWYQVNHPELITISCVQFVNDSIGWACGSKVENLEEWGVILYTNDRGENWSEQDINTEVSKVYELFFIDEFIGWAVCSDGIIIKTTNAGGTSFEGVDESLANKYLLADNYPNPFTSETTIIYSIPAKEKVELKIYDLSGKEVATIVNEVKTQGTYEINFDASQLGNTVYYYKLKVGDFVQAKKMVLLK